MLDISPFPAVVNVNVTVPAVVSASEGMYVAPKVQDCSGEKVPVPEVAQVPPVAIVTLIQQGKHL